MRRSRFSLVLFFALAVLQSARAFPCGLCREDARAAVYSYEAMQKVTAEPERLEFVVLKITGAVSQKTAGQISQWLTERSGIDPDTVKISTFQKSAGFVLEKKDSKEELVSDLSEDFAGLFFKIW